MEPLPKGANFIRAKFLWEIGLHIAGNPATPYYGNRDICISIGSGSGDTYKPWLRMSCGSPILAHAVARGELEAAIVNPSAMLTQAVRGKGVVVAQNGRAAEVGAAILRNDRSITATIRTEHPPHDTAWAKALGIVHQVSTFTTNHAAGEPVLSYKKPNVGKSWPVRTPPDSDEFNENQLGTQWQWQANPKPNWMFPSRALGFVRLFNTPLPEGFQNFWDVPNLLLQKFPGPVFTATAKVNFRPLAAGNETGLIVMGRDYAYLSLLQKDDGLYAGQTIVKDADQGNAETRVAEQPVNGNEFYLRVTVAEGAVASFSLSNDGQHFTPLGEPFRARQGRWIGAKFGLFAARTSDSGKAGYADYDWVRVD